MRLKNLGRSARAGESLTVVSFEDASGSIVGNNGTAYHRYRFGFKECCGECTVNPHHDLYTSIPLEELVKLDVFENQDHKKEQVENLVNIERIIEAVVGISNVWNVEQEEQKQELHFGTKTFSVMRRGNELALYVATYRSWHSYNQRIYYPRMNVDASELSPLIEYLEAAGFAKLAKLKELITKTHELAYELLPSPVGSTGNA